MASAGLFSVEAGIPLVVRALIARYGDRAAGAADSRARVLEACGDREISAYWDTVRQHIEAFERTIAHGRREFSDPDAGAIAAAREAAFGHGALQSDIDPFAERGEDEPDDADGD